MKRLPALDLTPTQHERLVEEDIPDTLSSGIALASNFATDQQIEVLEAELDHFRSNPVHHGRRLLGLTMTGVERSYRYRIGYSYPLGLADSISEYGAGDLYRRALSGTRRSLLPNIFSFGQGLTAATQAYGRAHATTELADWEASRIRVFKYLPPQDPPQIASPHFDSAENIRDIRFALGFGDALFNDQPIGTGDLEAFIGYGLGERIGVPPKAHSVSPTAQRSTLIFDRIHRL